MKKKEEAFAPDEEMIFVLKCKRDTRIDSPYSNNNPIWHAYVNVKEMPTQIPTDVNPRETKMTTKVAKGIIDGLETDNGTFYAKNRGILISAKSIKTDGFHTLELDMGKNNINDRSKYGILDGGHTYRAIVDNATDLDPENIQYVHLEIMTNIDDIDGMAAARNSSVQVNDKAIAELADKFEFIKQAIKHEPFFKDVAYKQNEKNKSIDSIDIVRLMYALNKDKYSDDIKQPIQAYSGKAQVLKDYLTDYDKSEKDPSFVNPYKKIAPLLPEITRLYDRIVEEMPIAYQESQDGNSKFGLVKGVDSKKGKSKYYKQNIQYQISQGLIFPIFSGFRALIKDNGSSYSWEANPESIWEEVSKKLVANTISMSRQLGNNPQSAGKSSTLWAQNYDTINTAKIKDQLKKLQEK